MARLVWTDAARGELGMILGYIARRNGDGKVGRAFVAQLQQHCRKLASLPGIIGQARPELGPEVRTLPFGNYVIVFRYVGDVFLVSNVLERHRDIGRVLDAGEE